MKTKLKTNKMNLNDTPMLDASSPDFKEQLDFALWSLNSSSDYSNDRSREYNGQPWTDDGIRGATEVKGITFRDIRDCYCKALLLSSGPGPLYESVENNTWRTQDIYKIDLNTLDPLAVAQNLSCEIEKLMGIYPNIPKLE